MKTIFRSILPKLQLLSGQDERNDAIKVIRQMKNLTANKTNETSETIKHGKKNSSNITPLGGVRYKKIDVEMSKVLLVYTYSILSCISNATDSHIKVVRDDGIAWDNQPKYRTSASVFMLILHTHTDIQTKPSFPPIIVLL